MKKTGTGPCPVAQMPVAPRPQSAPQAGLRLCTGWILTTGLQRGLQPLRPCSAAVSLRSVTCTGPGAGEMRGAVILAVQDDRHRQADVAAVHVSNALVAVFTSNVVTGSPCSPCRCPRARGPPSKRSGCRGLLHHVEVHRRTPVFCAGFPPVLEIRGDGGGPTRARPARADLVLLGVLNSS
jgi:hypothetical protein